MGIPTASSGRSSYRRNTEEIRTLAIGRSRHLRLPLTQDATRPESRYASCLGVGASGSHGALAQRQSSGLLIHWFRVRPPDAPREFGMDKRR